MLHHGGVEEVQLHQLVVALPALVPKAVVIIGVAAEVQVEPVLVGAVPLFLLHVPKSPKAPAHMVEHPVQQHPQSRLVKGLTDLGQVVIGAQAGVQVEVVPGVIAVAVAVEHRVQQHRVRTKRPDVLCPVQQTENAVLQMSVVFRRSPAQTQRVNLIDHSLLKPHDKNLPAPTRLWSHHTTFVGKAQAVER